MAESKQRKKDRERLAQLRQDTTEVWDSPRVVKVGQPSQPPVAPEVGAPAAVERRTRKHGWWVTLHSVKQYGFTHPNEGRYLLLPPEFDAILALEKKAVAQVVLEVLRQTIGWVDPSGETDTQGRRKRRVWARLGHKHFEFICGSASQAYVGLKRALQEGYLVRRPCRDGFEYSVKWREERTRASSSEDL
jgi:hypothetical protein